MDRRGRLEADVDVQEFMTKDVRSGELGWGFVRIEGLRDVDGRARCYVEGNDVAGISIFGPGERTSLVFLKMYRLPRADAKFGEDLKFFGEGTVPGEEPGMLALRG